MTRPLFNATPLPVHDGTLEVHLLGLVDFDAVQGLQEYQIYELSGRTDRHGVLYLCEHPQTISMGREASRSHLLLDDEELQRQALPVRWVARGGGAFLHAPGQLAIYLQLPLQRLGIGLAEFRFHFETALLGLCQELKIPARRHPQETGIWSRNGQLGFFGAAVKSWISCQGMFLNIAIDPRLLHCVISNPSGTRSTSMQSQRLDSARMPHVREALIRHLSTAFGYSSAEVSTGHPLLRRILPKVFSHA